MPCVPVVQVTIAYPDEGAWKRFHYQFKDEGYPEVICTKVRDGAKRIVRLKVRGKAGDVRVSKLGGYSIACMRGAGQRAAEYCVWCFGGGRQAGRG
jgi:hypothetical protein